MLAIGFGAGLARRAPGTVGTAVAIPGALLLWQLGPIENLLVLVCAFAAGIWICKTGARYLQECDPGAVVWDEMVGLWLSLLWMDHNAGSLILGFCLFRLFDIFKPWPIRWVDRRIEGGFGIMADDALAAVYTLLSMQIIDRLH